MRRPCRDLGFRSCIFRGSSVAIHLGPFLFVPFPRGRAGFDVRQGRGASGARLSRRCDRYSTQESAGGCRRATASHRRRFYHLRFELPGIRGRLDPCGGQAGVGPTLSGPRGPTQPNCAASTCPSPPQESIPAKAPTTGAVWQMVPQRRALSGGVCLRREHGMIALF